MATEEPDYEVVRTTADYEIRRYDSLIVAETDVSGDFSGAGNRAFRILAGYIFGNNRRRGVTFGEPDTVDASMKIAMTAPVISKESAQGANNYTYSFVMPAEFSVDSLPLPLDSRVRIRVVPERLLAVRKYSGRWSERKYTEHKNALLETLEGDGIEIHGTPIFARYNGPWTPWFMRRNEIMVPVSAEA